MWSFRDFITALRVLRIDRTRPVIVHTSLSAFGPVRGGAETVVGALLAAFDTVVMPTFTYKTMVLPETGPLNNALTYGTGEHLNRMALFYRPDLPADRMMGVVAEALRAHPEAARSMHPILSFAGVRAASILAAQSLPDPLAPIRVLADAGGWVLLLGVTHKVNTSCTC